MSTQQNDIPTCPLRKPCGWSGCDKQFGRKIKMNRGKPYLVSIEVWEETECCCVSHARKLQVERRRAKKDAENVALQLTNWFLYVRPMA